MNLIERPTTESTIVSFRNFQYGLIPEFITIGLNYLIKFGLEYDSTLYDPDGSTIEYIDSITYKGFNHYATKMVKVKISNVKKNQYFLILSIPELINDIFFVLNNIYYVPIFYIYDEPITIKKNSINLFSLFQPITLYINNNRIIFMRMNIMLTDFLRIIGEEWKEQDFLTDNFNINFSSAPNPETLQLLSTKLKCKPECSSIISKINDLFFDRWTEELYYRFYKINSNINNIVYSALSRFIYNQKPSFVDLRYKRLTFIEPLLRPYFKSISTCVESLLRNYQPFTLGVNLESIVNHFLTSQSNRNGLGGERVYDLVNGYSSVLAHIASFKNPFGKGILPPDVSSIHWTHQERLCVTSISNKNPGSTVSLIPNQQIDLRYGCFCFSDEDIHKE